VTEEKELVRVEDITFAYDSVPVLEEVSFLISQGDFLAILGPNGSGKTTLIKVILGLLKPSQGRILIMGQPIEAFREWSKIGYVPQKATHFDPFFPASVKEVVAMAFQSQKKRSAQRKKDEEKAIEAALESVGMEANRNRPIGSLSGGQQQRVFIARAIINSPDLLFLDEPTTGVDAATQEHFYETLHLLNKDQQITIILVTHDVGIVNRHVSKVACLNQKLVYHGSHDDFCQSEAFKALAGGGHLVSHTH
jgi:zinc transport system ATP-binding protein